MRLIRAADIKELDMPPACFRRALKTFSIQKNQSKFVMHFAMENKSTLSTVSYSPDPVKFILRSADEVNFFVNHKYILHDFLPTLSSQGRFAPRVI